MKNTLSLKIACGLFLMCAVTGCSEEDLVHEVDVSGTITIDGEPIPKGTISFVAKDGSTPTGGGVIKDGKYTAIVPPGEKVVMVLGQKHVGQVPEFPDMPDSTMRDKYEIVTPPAYNAEHLTPLTATISEPQEGLDFELKGDFQAS